MRKRGTIRLQPAFGDSIEADLVEVEIGLVSYSKITPTIKVIVAACGNLNTNILLDSVIYDALCEQDKLYNPYLELLTDFNRDQIVNKEDQSIENISDDQTIENTVMVKKLHHPRNPYFFSIYK